MTDREYPDYTDGVWDDGEWISWDWINGQLHQQERQAQYPKADPEVVEVFEDLISAAQRYKETTGRYLQVWGELGELYAQIRYGVKLHKPHTRGSDGKLDNDFVEIKTISPEKVKQRIVVKRAGNFSKLLIVRIDADFGFQSRLLDRKLIGKGPGKLARVSWPKELDAEANGTSESVE
jgi:hypothetical protein